MSANSITSCNSVLKHRFKSMAIFKASSIDAAIINEQWHNLHSRYTEPHRHYHTLTHLAQMFKWFDSYSSWLNHVDVVQLAIWYHDIIYDPTRSDNERQSADYFVTAYAEYLPQSTIMQVEALIMMTAAGHQLDKTVNKALLNDATYFLDMDLAVLGQEWVAYEQYAQQVRLEYQHVPLDAYKQGRNTVLHGFLQQEQLYFNDAFFEQLEVQARSNITKEIKRLLL